MTETLPIYPLMQARTESNLTQRIFYVKIGNVNSAIYVLTRLRRTYCQKENLSYTFRLFAWELAVY
ncbi:MAG: hypothetical protein LBT09_01185 [Planctomycetaceae bacterium]|nr:hypothetical protein [Planctomycetaceae bacterium]